MATTEVRTPARVALVLAALVAATAHVPVTPQHLREAPYMGVLFILLSLACLCLAGVALLSDRAEVLMAAMALCAGAIVGYALTRLVAFPELADDVGNWFEPWGVVSVLSEAVVVGAAAQLLAQKGSRRPAAPSLRR